MAPAAIGNYIAGTTGGELEAITRVQHLKGADLRLQQKGLRPSLVPGVYVRLY